MINPKAAFLSAGFVLLMLAAGIWADLQVPADAPIAVHFSGGGTPDGWMTPFPAFFVGPLIGALFWLLLLVIPRLGRRAANLARAPRAYGIVWMLPALITVPTQLLILAPTLGLSWSPSRLSPALLGTVFILLGNVLGKLPPNPFIGVRTPWTLADDRVWDQTHRFAGWVFVAGGFFLLGCALLLPPDLHPRHLVLLVVLTAAALSTVKSWLLSRKMRGS